ncbi:MAG: translocation/assembly module TamB [Endozoicomonas sp. (ex Botrylloides leachii)]|nr:translocation/assembly module TamB [Endozoicomonas sp. (ex Botrylloides leachii)]
MKWLTRSLMSLCIFLSLVLLLLFTHTGSLLIWHQIQHWIPQLKGELVEGCIGRRFAIEKFTWSNPAITAKADRISVNWQLSSFLKQRVKITQFDILNPSIQLVTVPNEKNRAQDKANAKDAFTSPFPIDIHKININHFNLYNNGLHVSFSHIDTGLTFNNNVMTIKDGVIKQLTIDTAEKQSQNVKHSIKTTIALPAIDLPFNIKAANLQFIDSRFEKEQIPHITVAFTSSKHEITLQTLAIQHPITDLKLSGSMRLTGSYPVDLTLDATLHKALSANLLENQTIHGSLTGNLNQLNVRLNINGTNNAFLTGTIAPLKDQLPFNLTLDWQKLQWLLTGKMPAIHIHNGCATAIGNLSQYTFQLNTHLSASKQPPIYLSIDGTGNRHRLFLDSAKLKTNEGNATIKGKLNWADNLDWQGTINLQRFNPGFWMPELPGKISGVINHHFYTTKEGWFITISNALAEGTLRNHPVKLKGKLDGNSNKQWQFQNTELTVGANALHISGTLAKQWDLKASFNGSDLNQLHPDLAGMVSGHLKLTGNMQHPSIIYQLNSPKLRWQAFSLSSLHSSGVIKKDNEYSGVIDLHLDKLTNSEITVNNIALNLQGKQSDHQLTITSEGSPVSANLTLLGDWHKNKWHGLLKQAQLGTTAGNWVLNQPFSLSLDAQKKLMLEKQCWHSGKASLCINPAWISKTEGQISFSLDKFELQKLNTFYPNTLSWQADLSGNGHLKWINHQPTVTLLLHTTPGVIIANNVKKHYETLNLALTLDNKNLHSKLHFLSHTLGQADINLKVTDLHKKQSLSGQFAINDLLLNTIEPFIPDINQLKGTLRANGYFSGSLNAPLFFGRVALTEGQVETTEHAINISQLNTQMNITGSSAILSGTMQVGEGTLNLGGKLDWANMPLSGRITLKGNGLETQYSGLGQLRLNPDLTLNFGKEQTITGQLAIPWARIIMKQLPSRAVTVSDDVTIIRARKKTEKTKGLTTPIKVNIRAAIGDNVKLEAFGLQTKLQGALTITQLPEKPFEVQGTVRLLEGKYRSFGQDLVVDEGKIIFSGPANNPYLSLKAIRNPDTMQDKNVTVGVIVKGSLTQPEWIPFSDPAMPQTEQYSYLLRGRAINSKTGDRNALESALVGLGVTQLNGLVTTLGDSVGFSDLTLDTKGSGNDTEVTLSGYVIPKLQVQYGVGIFNAIGEIKIKYELMPQLYLQAVSGLAQAVDIFYRFTL